MHRAALGCALILTLSPCVRALAHGEPPAAYAILSHDDQGARAVRLSAGLALRRGPQRFQFVCPSAWGDQYGAPLAALEDGTIVVGAARGLMLLREDGQVRAHPDPRAVGETRELVRSPRGVFSLRIAQEGSEVLAVDAERVHVLWKGPHHLYSLAALDDTLSLVRANGLSVEQITIAAADGAELERQVARFAEPVDYAYARATTDAAYALVVFDASTVLGSLRMGTFTTIAEGESAIAGPLSAADGTILARDGKLSQLIGGESKLLADGPLVLCLEQNAGVSYACLPEGIARLKDAALGEPLFQLRWLSPPDLTSLAGGSYDDCNAQWQDLRVDLLAVGISLLADAPADAGSAPLDASARDGGVDALADASIAVRADGSITDGANSGLSDASDIAKSGHGGCGALPWNDAHRARYAVAVGLVLLLVQRRRGGALPRSVPASTGLGAARPRRY